MVPALNLDQAQRSQVEGLQANLLLSEVARVNQCSLSPYPRRSSSTGRSGST